MSGDREWIKERLWNWARWVSSAGVGLRLGYPRASCIARLMPGSSRSDDLSDRDVSLVNDLQAQRVHAALGVIRSESVPKWEAVWLCYVGDPAAPRGQRRALTLDETAQRQGVDRSTIGRRLRWVELRLAELLHAPRLASSPGDVDEHAPI